LSDRLACQVRYSDCLQSQSWSSSLTSHLLAFASIIWGPTSIASLPLTVSGKACCWNFSMYDVSGNLVSNCCCFVTTEMDAGAAASIADGKWLHQAHASSSTSRASSTDGERGSTPGTVRPSSASDYHARTPRKSTQLGRTLACVYPTNLSATGITKSSFTASNATTVNRFRMLSSISAPATACAYSESQRHQFSTPCKDRKRRASR
jgi:hypothetical protein